MQGQNVVQLQLPSGTRRFTFTFESDEPGPVTLEVSIRPLLKRPALALLPAPDDSETEPESEPKDNTKVQTDLHQAFGHDRKRLPDSNYYRELLHVFELPQETPIITDVTFKDPCRISESPVEQEMLDYGFLTGEDLDLMTHGTDLPNLGLNFHSPKALHIDRLKRLLRSYSAEENQLMQEAEDNLDHLNIDVDARFDDPDEEEDMETAATNDIDEDDPDPFIPDEGFSATNYRNLVYVPPHLLTIYAVVSWLHLQFHLPRVACNALLTIFACILVALAPTINVPFVTLQSSNRVLGVDTTIFTLPVCPTCRDGNLRAVKTPIIKYPYLPLSKQIKSLLKIPGLEAVLDGWHSKPRTIGKYTDIFDGDTCRTKLKGPDGKLFFSNLPHEQHGPDGELRIGVNLGADWFIVLDIILPGPKEQNPDQIQRFLRPIISDLLCLWRVGIKIPTESCPQAFRPQTNEEQRELGERYRRLTTASARKNFVKEHATQYTQLSRLPYFNLVEQIVIDPMHNLYLGLIKTHFYNIWVQGKILHANHELDVFHDMLADVRLDLVCGSLTADQWLLLATVYGPIITYTLQHYPKDSLPSQTASIMLKASNDEREPVAGLAALSKDLDDAGVDVFFDYVVIDSKRYYASRAVGTNCSCLVHVIIPGTTVIHAYGEVLEIFQFNQNLRNVDDSLWFACMHWFVPWRGEREKVWDDLIDINIVLPNYSADVRLWQLGEYKS
ncbi:hypothetical protein DFJ58DRAFT_843947 [Suillus subalutaceus]|uniref:uncharacterized protein n=1 Tax=Suillus subalutaceus TaxID=48586 RepID=UPI001B8867BA|nr:uncharacterized protein DFJ58DRAFT_843947 [Suillus subalutaceus]KAG1844856.1 hypothetical protein DFJ58DRAFT_843947 [Suillus subalutaceus]